MIYFMYYIMSEIFHQFKSYYNFRSMAKPKAVELQNVWNEKKVTATFSFFKLVLEFFITLIAPNRKRKTYASLVFQINLRPAMIFKLVEKFKTDEAVSIKCSCKSAFFFLIISHSFFSKNHWNDEILGYCLFFQRKKNVHLIVDDAVSP